MKPCAFILTALLSTAIAAPADTTYNALAAREEAGLFGNGDLAKRMEAGQAEGAKEAMTALQAMTAEMAGQSQEAILFTLLRLFPKISSTIGSFLPQPVKTKTPARGLEARDISAQTMEMLDAVQADLAAAAEQGEAAFIKYILPKLPGLDKIFTLISRRDVSSEAAMSAKSMEMLQAVQSDLAMTAEQSQAAILKKLKKLLPKIVPYIPDIIEVVGGLLKRESSAQADMAIEAAQMLQTMKAEFAMAAEQGQEAVLGQVATFIPKIFPYIPTIIDTIGGLFGKRDTSAEAGMAMEAAEMLKAIQAEISISAEQGQEAILKDIVKFIPKIVPYIPTIIDAAGSIFGKRDVSAEAGMSTEAVQTIQNFKMELAMATEQGKEALLPAIASFIPAVIPHIPAVIDAIKGIFKRDMSSEAAATVQMLQSMQSELAMSAEQSQEAFLKDILKYIPKVLPHIPTIVNVVKDIAGKRDVSEQSKEAIAVRPGKFYPHKPPFYPYPPHVWTRDVSATSEASEASQASREALRYATSAAYRRLLGLDKRDVSEVAETSDTAETSEVAEQAFLRLIDVFKNLGLAKRDIDDIVKRETAEAALFKLGKTSPITGLVKILTNLLNTLLDTINGKTNGATKPLTSLLETLIGGATKAVDPAQVVDPTKVTTVVPTVNSLLEKLGIKLGKREQAETSMAMLESVSAMVSELAVNMHELNGPAKKFAQAVADLQAFAAQS